MMQLRGFGRRTSLVFMLAAQVTILRPARAQETPAKPEPAARFAAQEDDPDGTIRFLETRLKEDPADPVLPTRLGSACLERAKRSGDFRYYARADAAIGEALKRDPTYFPAVVLQGSCRVAQHRFQDAVDAAERALALQPSAREALSLRGDARLQLGELAGAREDYQKLLDVEPDLLAHTRMAHLQFAEGDAAAAVASMDAALRAGERRADPPALIAWCAVRLGALRFRTGDWDEAAAWYAKADEIHPDDPDTLDHLAELHAARGEFEKALELSDRAIALSPRPEFQQARGDIHLAKTRGEDADGGAVAQAEALACYDKALDQYLQAAEAGHGHYYHHLAGMYCDVDALRDPPAAVHWARRDLQLRRTVTSLDAIAWALYHDGKFQDAAEWMDKALRDPTADAHVLYHAGLIYSRAGDTKKGRLYLRRAAAANPKFNEFHFHR